MKPEEVKAILEPFYKEIQKNVEESKMEQNLKFMHPDGVVVQKGKAAHYGLEQIGASMKKFHEEYAAKNIKRSNVVYCGCECCVCMTCDVSFDTPKGPASVKEHHIWKKHDGEWRMYHIEYEIVGHK